MLKAIIFDVDGTLALTEEAHRQAFNEVFKAWGLNWHWSQALYKKLLLVGGSKERIRHFASHYKPDGFEVVSNNDDTILKMYQKKTEVYTAAVSSGQVALRPGVERLIEESLSAGLRLGIATTTNIAPLKALFQGTLGVQKLDLFDAVAAGDMAKHKKPAPDLFLMALTQLGLEASDCLALEDSENGLKSAVGAKIPTIITINSYTKGQNFSDALAVISDLGVPETPFSPISGLAVEPDILDLSLAKKWHGLAVSAQ